MHAHAVTVHWERRGAAFTDHKYSRVHTLRFDGGAVVPGSSSPAVVRQPFSDPAAVDPEEAFVASLSSCHMLWFLDLAARAGHVVDHYEDQAQGFLKKREDGKLWLADVILAPEVRFAGSPPTPEAVAALHHHAHEECFLANAVKTRIEIRPR